jgi:hypothetical protein
MRYAIDFVVRLLKLILWVAIAFLVIEVFLAIWPGSTMHLQIGQPLEGATCDVLLDYMAFNTTENSILPYRG